MEIRSYLKDHILLFDGAMGTYYAARNRQGEPCCEMANLSMPEEIRAIHRAYLAAGCGAIKTNTFAANRPALGEKACREVIEAGFALAKEAAGDAFVFADIGPITGTEGMELLEEYRFVVDLFLEAGAEHFLFETHSQDACLHEMAAYIKARAPQAFVMVSFAAQPDGFTRSGQLARNLYRRAIQNPQIDAAGLNCVSGARHMVELVDTLEREEHHLLSAMPNAGYPTVLGERIYYDGDPGYFAQQLGVLAEKGVKILGGCCGTTPEYMAAAAKVLETGTQKRIVIQAALPSAAKQPVENRFWEALCDENHRPVAVELDPPEAADVTKFMAGARELQENGAAIITIADCPIARARMDASILACKIRRELHMEALPHMTCRDRNTNATKALLLGLCAEDIHNVLVVTGDPIPSASRDEVKSVYNFNSRMLAQYVAALNETVLPTPFRIFGALNVNAVNFGVQLRLAKEKIENGVCGFLTQPVLTEQALDNLKQARQELDAKLLGGIIPIVSYRNALFMNSEVAGITVDPKIIDLYEGKNREQGEELAVKISAAVAEAMADYVDGFYLMTPFGRTGLMARIMEELRQRGLT